MTILYPTPSRVKTSRSFGRGILRSTPSYKAAYTVADVRWYDLQLATAEDRYIDEQANLAEAQSRLDRGLCF